MNKHAVPMTALAFLISGTGVAAGPTNWTGFNVGIGGAGTFLDGKQSTYAYSEYCSGTCTTVTGDDSDSFTKAQAFGTVEAGYDFQTGWGVVGLVANYDFGNKAKFSHSALANGTDDSSGDFLGDFEHGVSIDKNWAIGGRLGSLATPTTLLYATGGYTRADVTQWAGVSGCNWYCTDYYSSKKETKGGYFIGAGVETVLSGPLSLKLEYRYADYGEVHHRANRDDGMGSYGDINQSADVTLHSVRAVISYRFN